MATITSTFYPSEFDTTNSSYNGIASSYPASNVVGKSATNPSGYGVGVGLRTGSGSATSAYFAFDVSEIPSDVTIVGVSCKVSIYGTASFTTRTSTRYIRLCKTTTGVGTQTTFTTGSSASTTTPEITSANGGSWTRDELDNLRLLVYVTRSSSNTTSTTYVYVRGIDLTIEYEEAGEKYTLTIQSNGFNVDPSESGEYAEGKIVPITISESSMPKVTLDGVDITSEFEAQSVATSYSGAPSASSYTGLSSGSSGVASAVGMTAESPYGGSLNWYGSSGATVDSQYAQYTFDTSSIPSTATNIEVACVVAGTAESSTYTHQSSGRYSVWALCCNGTEKSEQIYTTSTSVTTLSFSDTGTWTREELDGLQLRHYVGYYGGSTNGATLTITYTLPGGSEVYVYNLTITSDHTLILSESGGSKTLYVKQNGAWKAVSKVWQKTDGAWVAVDDVSTLFEGATDDTNSGYFYDN